MVLPETSLRQATLILSEKRLGLVMVVNGQNQLQGVFSVGDLARVMGELEGFQNVDLNAPISEFMVTNPLTIAPQELAAKAMRIMEDRSVLTLVVISENQRVVGVIQLYDILRAGIA